MNSSPWVFWGAPSLLKVDRCAQGWGGRQTGPCIGEGRGGMRFHLPKCPQLEPSGPQGLVEVLALRVPHGGSQSSARSS